MCLLPTDYAKNETILNFDLEDINTATICKTLDGDCLHLMKHPIIEGKNRSIIGLVLLSKKITISYQEYGHLTSRDVLN